MVSDVIANQYGLRAGDKILLHSLTNAYAIIRSGKVYHDIAINGDVAIYNSNTGILENADNLGLKGTLASVALSEGLATDTFRFWNSVLVKNGNNISNPDNYDRAQRTFMGSTGKPGEIYIVVSEGRNVDGKSPGLRKYECAKVLLDLGCIYGTMLDGGGSSTMYFNGRVLNSAKGNEKYTDLAIFFDENFYSDKRDDEKCYRAMYLIYLMP